MPRYDRTGPSGLGPRTGRGLGPCVCGPGMAWRRGSGRGSVPPQDLSKKDELTLLEEQAEVLQEELKGIKERTNELRAKK